MGRTVDGNVGSEEDMLDMQDGAVKRGSAPLLGTNFM
jgi:hypothetical protein